MLGRIVVIGVLFFTGYSIRSSATEPWADQRLPTDKGLLFWIDASVQGAAAEAIQTDDPKREDDTEISVAYDASGNGNHLRQESAEARPLYREIQNHAFLRFDGQADFLSVAETGLAARDYSVFLVASATSNPGSFRAFLSTRAPNTNDYQTGLNIDQGGGFTSNFTVINVEGLGQSGQQNLWSEGQAAFNTFHLIEVRSRAAATELFVDGERQSQRERTSARAETSLNEIALGKRLIADNVQLPGNFDGDIAEVLIYGGDLADDQRAAIVKYLQEKYKGIDEAAAPLSNRRGKFLQTISDPPAVQMHSPGFVVQELPVDLTNINNVLYRHDGSLFALGYDGNIHRLTDTDGDGLEDHAEIYFRNEGQLTGPIGMTLTPKGYPHGQGVVVSSKGKCSLFLDTNGDNRSDEERIIAQGWQQLGVGVDALGAAIDPEDGSIYFGLGTGDYTNAYRVGNDGKAGYRLDAQRGVILRIAPDLKSREIVCTGIRFPVAIRFNALGDLFCTDQEGATWMPNGNPFDELLHIQQGRHYGFPPRHPKHLPNVVDEPSVLDYRPQHQSTCGLNFNEAFTSGGKTFGPAHWQHDALVAGYSRGKLYRTKLVKTEQGYVAQNHLIGSTNQLLSDMCVSPDGGLIVAVHSGGPDWGSGPAGRGKLYRVRYADPDAPAPVAIWPQGDRQVRIAFDSPLRPSDLEGLASGVEIQRGRYVRAGDRFENFRPGYAVVQRQMSTPRFDHNVTGVQVSPDRRTLLIDTGRHIAEQHYAVTLRGFAKEHGAIAGDAKTLPQIPDTDLHYSLHGVTARLESASQESFETWLPHIDLNVARELTQGSAAHDAFHTRLQRATSLTLQTLVDVKQMLQPAVQPGSALDHEYPPEKVTVVIQSRHALEVTGRGAIKTTSRSDNGSFVCELEVDTASVSRLPLKIRVRREASDQPLDVGISWHTGLDTTPRAFALNRFIVPWAETLPTSEDAESDNESVPEELAGGSWGRGRKVFFGGTANCSKCHTIHGEGGQVGPDLTNLRHRDYHSVLRDIKEPNFAINPDHLSYSVLLNSGQVLTGLIKHEPGKLIVGTTEGKWIEVDQDEVDEVVASGVSIMPTGIDKQLRVEQMKDLLTFLVGPLPHMPRDLSGAPKPRSRQDVAEVLAGSAEQNDAFQPLHIVLVAGKKDHGPGEHDYPAWLTSWTELFRAADQVTVSTAFGFPDEETIRRADALVFYQRGLWDQRRQAAIDAFLARGGGVTYLHYAVDGRENSLAFADRIGLAAKTGETRFRHGPLDLIFDSTHPVARNLSRIRLVDESYWNLDGDTSNVSLLASGVEENAPRPQVWCREHSGGRVFVSIPGHYSWTFDDPLFRILLLRGIAWTTGESVDRFNPLATMGVELE